MSVDTLLSDIASLGWTLSYLSQWRGRWYTHLSRIDNGRIYDSYAHANTAIEALSTALAQLPSIQPAILHCRRPKVDDVLALLVQPAPPMQPANILRRKI